MSTYRVFVPMASDPRFGDFYVTRAVSPAKAFSNIHFRLYGRGKNHYYQGWRYWVLPN